MTPSDNLKPFALLHFKVKRKVFPQDREVWVGEEEFPRATLAAKAFGALTSKENWTLPNKQTRKPNLSV